MSIILYVLGFLSNQDSHQDALRWFALIVLGYLGLLFLIVCDLMILVIFYSQCVVGLHIIL